MMRNCIGFAFALWWRRRQNARPGSRVYFPIARWSDWGPFWHVLYVELAPHGRLRMVSYKPPKSTAKKRAVPPPCFRGNVKWGDAKERRPATIA